MRKTILAISLMASLVAASNATIVYSNNGGTGDNFTNASGTNQGQAIASSTNWVYNNTRASGYVGINTAYARSGNGSARMGGPNNAKSDIEYLAGPFNLGGNFFATGSLGRLGDLGALSYEWYRSSTSTATAHLHPAMRILVDADGNLNTTGDRGGLVFERVYNSLAVADDVWTADTIGMNSNLWSFSAGMSTAQLGYNVTLSQWIAGAGTISGNSAILGFSMGIGSGWNTFDGAVDNATWNLGGVTTTSNFEVVPEPATMAALGLGAAAMLRRRKKA